MIVKKTFHLSIFPPKIVYLNTFAGNIYKRTKKVIIVADFLEGEFFYNDKYNGGKSRREQEID